MKNKKNQPLRTITHSDGQTYSVEEYTQMILEEYEQAVRYFGTVPSSIEKKVKILKARTRYQ